MATDDRRRHRSSYRSGWHIALQGARHEGIVLQIWNPLRTCAESTSTRPCALSRRMRVSNCVPSCNEVSAREDKSSVVEQAGRRRQRRRLHVEIAGACC